MEQITARDIAEANEAVLVRTARVARFVGRLVIALAALGVLAWLWFMARSQLELDTAPVFTFEFGEDGEPSLAARLDALTANFSVLVESAVAGAIGVALLLWSSRVLNDLGESLHGVEVGDPIPWPAGEPEV